jgi:putative membrane protein
MTTHYLWLQALHVVSVVAWFAGLFYLPRLFVHHAQTGDAAGRARFEAMEKRAFVVMTIAAGATVVLGYLLVVIHTALVTETWFRVKLVLVAGLAVYHYRCYRWTARLRDDNEPRDSGWLRRFADIPVPFLLAIVVLAVARPF